MFRKLKLFHRVFLHGILLILALAAAAILAFQLIGNPKDLHTIFEREAKLLVRRIEASDNTETALSSLLRQFHYVTDATVAVFSHEGLKLAAAGDVPLPPLSHEDLNTISSSGKPFRRHFAEIAIPLHPKRAVDAPPAYLIVSWRHPHLFRLRFSLAVLLALIVIGATSYPLARSIAGPLKTVTQTAKALRDGDLTARAKTGSNDEMGVLAVVLNEMADALERRIIREKELLANVSHEFLTPLARIRVALEIASESGQDTGEIGRQLSGIADDVQELSTLVNDVLTATRADILKNKAQPTMPTAPASTDLCALIADTVRAFEQRYGQSVHLALPKACPELELDSALFKRVLDNLLANSLRYTEGTPEITVALERQNTRLLLSVNDRGVGVPPSDLARLFEPFYRGEKSRSKQSGGMGLGLTLCKRIVEAHGGKISARNRPGGGLSVVIALVAAPQ